MEHTSESTLDHSTWGQREAVDPARPGRCHATLVLDHLGRILSCGEAAARLLGASESMLLGRRITEFIAELFPSGSSPSYRARYVGYLCADDAWRRFAATDGSGHSILVEACLARMASARSAQEIFLLNLRRPD